MQEVNFNSTALVIELQNFVLHQFKSPMALCKAVVTPVHLRLNYNSFALNHRNMWFCP